MNPANSQEKSEMDSVAASEDEQQATAQASGDSQEQEVVVDGQDGSGVDAESSAVPVRRRKKRVKRLRQVTEDELMPRPSIWPFALAISLCIMLVGVAIHPILLGIGAVMVIASIIGWALERR